MLSSKTVNFQAVIILRSHVYCLLCIINCKVIICTLRYFHSNMKAKVSASLPSAGRRKWAVVYGPGASATHFLSRRPAGLVTCRDLQLLGPWPLLLTPLLSESHPFLNVVLARVLAICLEGTLGFLRQWCWEQDPVYPNPADSRCA